MIQLIYITESLKSEGQVKKYSIVVLLLIFSLFVFIPGNAIAGDIAKGALIGAAIGAAIGLISIAIDKNKDNTKNELLDNNNKYYASTVQISDVNNNNLINADDKKQHGLLLYSLKVAF